ncbi:site-2 protease family protein [Pyxidicoccus sp. 3LG]
MDRLTLLLWLWMMVFAVSVIWALSQAAVTSAFGVRPLDVRVGYGPKLVAWRMAGIDWSLHPITFGGSASFAPRPEDAPQEPPLKSRLNKLPPPLHALSLAIPWYVQIGVAMACLGPAEGFHQFTEGFPAVFNLAAMPERVERFVGLLRDGELVRAWGIMSARLAALNLLPIPTLAGGYLMLLPWRDKSPKWVTPVSIALFALVIPWSLYVAYLFVRAIF